MRALGAMMIVLTIVAACGGVDRPPCYRGDFIGCTCASGAHGYAACSATEDGYGVCVCDGTTPGVDGGTRDATAFDVTTDSGKLGLFASCTDATQCESGVCFSYGDGQSLCTKNCTATTATSDCPAPATGCNGKGVCKP
jgi:hypothetical protein